MTVLSTQFVKTSFYTSYIMMITTGTICFIEALTNTDPKIRHIMNLEVCISVIAGYFYSEFITKINKSISLDYVDINATRYTDWFISTPFMLIGLCLVLAYNNKSSLRLRVLVCVLLLNFGMLTLGYLGEVKKISKKQGLVLGFVFFILLFGLIYRVFVHHHHFTFDNVIIYGSFFIVWTLYGVVYTTDDATKNVCYNALDVVSKAIIGIFFWAYLTRVIVL